MSTPDGSANIQSIPSIPVAPTMSGPGLPPVPQTHIGFESQVAIMAGAAPHPLVAKFTEGHISSMISNEDVAGKREHTRCLVQLAAIILLVVIVLAFVILFCWLFAAANGALVEKVLFGVFGFAGGLGAGLGAPKLLAMAKGNV